MKIAKTEQIDETRQHMRDGDGSVLLHHIAQGESLPANCRLLARITLQPGSSIGEHTHTNEAEIYYILSGHAEMSDNGSAIRLEPGDTCVTSNASHSIRCAGNEPLEFRATIIKG
jgi:mannose-6-phosphate isomerase-like protein (cupin superfamily)